MISILQPFHPLLKNDTWQPSRSMKSLIEYLIRVLYEVMLIFKFLVEFTAEF